MNPLQQSNPDAVASLQMENNLLTHEIRLLRARLKAAKVSSLVGKHEDIEVVSSEQMDSYRQADEDIRHLVRRLNQAGIGSILRRRPGFRTLIDRYGSDNA
jgi:hypothetical protein